MSRYYCIIRLDSNPELEYEPHEALNERLSRTIQEWAEKNRQKMVQLLTLAGIGQNILICTKEEFYEK